MYTIYDTYIIARTFDDEGGEEEGKVEFKSVNEYIYIIISYMHIYIFMYSCMNIYTYIYAHVCIIM